MKLLLVRPASSMGGRVGSHSLQHPIGLCLLAAVAREAGWEARILDCEVEKTAPAAFAGLLEREKPDVVGFTAMTPVVERAARMAAVVKRILPESKTLVGGPHASALPVRTLEEFDSFDIAATGEGEPKITEILSRAAGGWPVAPLPGCAVRTGAEILDFTNIPVPHADLDALPLPARELLPLSLYRGAPTPGFPQAARRATVIFTTRGCSGACIFCASRSVFGRRPRFRSVDNLLAEMRDCRDRFGFLHFTIDDDAFTFDRRRVMDFCEAAAALGVTWDCDARADHVDAKLLAAMARSGCRKVAYGVESGSPRILEKVNKGVTLDRLRRAFALTREAGVLSCGFFMVGQHPDENRDDARLTARFIREIAPDLITVAVALPFPGTALRTLMEREGLLPDAPWSAYSPFTARPFTRTRALSPSDLQRLRGRLLRGFYLRPSYILRRLLALRSPAEAAYWLKAGMQFLLYILAPSRGADEDGWPEKERC